MKHTHRNQLRHFLRDPERRRTQNREAAARWRAKHGIAKESANHRAKHRDYHNELSFRFSRTRKHKGILGSGISIVSLFELKEPTFVIVLNGNRQMEGLRDIELACEASVGD